MKITITSKQLTYISGGVFPKVKDSLVVVRMCVFCHSSYIVNHSRVSKYCSHVCGGRARESRRGRPCLGCPTVGRFYNRKGEGEGYCLECVPDLRYLVGNRSLNQVYEEKDYDILLQYLRSKVEVNQTNCWIWQGTAVGGYGTQSMIVNGRTTSLKTHRLALEAKLGRPFVEHAHHICANRLCCNPDHLELASANENIAEMLARQSFIKRIAELESQVDLLKQVNESLTQRVADLEASVSLSKSL